MAAGDKSEAPITGRPEIELGDGSKVTDWAALMGEASLADETSVAEYKVEWGGAAGGSNSGSTTVFVADDVSITIPHVGDYTFDVLPYQTTTNMEAGTMVGGRFNLKNGAGTVIRALVFPSLRVDAVNTNLPYSGGGQTVFVAGLAAGTYRLGFLSAAGAGAGNRVSYSGYAQVIVRRGSLVSGDQGDLGTTARYAPQTDYAEGDPILEPDPNTDEIHVWRADADFRTGTEPDFDGTGFTQGEKVTNPIGIESHIVQSDTTPRLFSGSGIGKAVDIIQDEQLMPRAFRPALATQIYGTDGGGKIGTAIDPTNGLIYAVRAGKTVIDDTIPSLSDNWIALYPQTTTTVTLTGTTDADDQTTIPYAGDVSKGYLVEIEVSAGRWLPQNYGDRTDEAPNYFQVLYDKGQARFELWAVGTALQGKPYRIAVYGTAPAEAAPDPVPSVERVVAIKNPGFGTILGDFNFMMSGGGVRSIQIRTVSGTIAYTDFNTYWSAGAGGDNDAPLAGNWDETWRYASDANMTAHNHYQHVEFIANGWFYHVHIVVGPGFNDNRLTLTRWRVA